VSGLPLLARLRRVFALVSDPRTPRLPRLAVALAIAYFLWPADLLPDFLPPVLGWLDDAVLLWLSFRWLLGSVAGGAADSGGSRQPPRSGSDEPSLRP
jgi:uncharacterized membrane protein YkvA (DUF1232 family)